MIKIKIIFIKISIKNDLGNNLLILYTQNYPKKNKFNNELAMIIETLTAFTSVKIVLETLEIFHMVHVGHITGKAGYKGGNIIKRAIQEQQLKWQDKKYPALKLEREAETLYDFEATGNAAQAISDINNEARDYLSRLKDSVNNLKKAKDYFVAIHTNLTELVNALTDRENCQFLSQLLEFKSNLESFKDEYNQFWLSIEPPPRQVLYIADMLSESQVIEQYNDRLKTIETYTDLLEETKQKIIDQLNKGEETKQEIIEQLTKDSNIVFTLPSTSSRIPSFEQLQRDIKQCINNPNQLSETMNAILPDNAKLAVICTDITLISLAFKQTHQQEAVIQIRELKNNPNWFRLLTETEQIEVGQRIVLHVMNEAKHSEDKKLNLAEIFLQQHVSNYLINQIKISQFAHEMACVLRSWQIKKCEQMIEYLSRLTQGGALPNTDGDGLLEWLKTKRKIQNATAFFTEVLVSPCCFKHRSIESALAHFKSLAPDESIKIIQQHFDSHWGAVWDENDTLIQLPKSFDSSILPKHRRELENQQNLNVVSPVIYKLAQALIVDLQQLKIKLENHLTHHLDAAFDGPISNIINKVNEVHQMESREEDTKSERIVGALQENIEKVKQENEVLKTELEKTKDQLKESEAKRAKDKEIMEAQRIQDKAAMEAMEVQRERDKAAMEVQRERDKADSEARLKELEEKFEARLDKLYALSAQQPTSTSPVSDTNIPETSNNTFLFRR